MPEFLNTFTVMKEHRLTDVSRRRFDVLQSPVQLQGSPDFGRLPRFNTLPSPPPPPAPPFPVFLLLSFLPFNSYAATLSPLMNRQSRNFASAAYFFPSTDFFLPTARLSRHNPRSGPRNFRFPEINGIIITPVYSFYCPRQ